VFAVPFATARSSPPLPGMSTSPIAKAWYLLLAANENMVTRPRRKLTFFALPCNTLDDLATQIALHNTATRAHTN
jgi:hypothetical protein